MFYKPHKFMLTLLLTCYSSTTFSLNTTDFFTALSSSWAAAFGVGPVWEQAGSKQTLNLAPGIVKTYTANKETDTLVEGEVFLGVHEPLPYALQGQFGLAAAMTNSTALSGQIWDDANPEFNNYTYQYKINHKHIALKGKLIRHCDWLLSPWISASLGAGFNYAYRFNNSPAIYEALPNPDFVSHRTTSFTYALGIGLERKLTPNTQMAIGYEFADWGKSQLGRAPGQTQGHGLSLSHFYTNGIMFNLSYTA
jgi:opacity protein-like surface antigen